MYRVRHRVGNKWYTWGTFVNKEDALEEYNNVSTPKMFIGPKGIEHKQYTDNGFVYNPKGH